MNDRVVLGRDKFDTPPRLGSARKKKIPTGLEERNGFLLSLGAESKIIFQQICQ